MRRSARLPPPRLLWARAPQTNQREMRRRRGIPTAVPGWWCRHLHDRRRPLARQPRSVSPSGVCPLSGRQGAPAATGPPVLRRRRRRLQAGGRDVPRPGVRARACGTRAAATAGGRPPRGATSPGDAADTRRRRPPRGWRRVPTQGPRRQSIRPTAVRRCGWKMRSAFLVGSGANPIRRECTVQYSTVHYGGVGPQQGSNRASLAPPPLTGGLWLAVATIQCCPRPHPSGGPVGRPLAHATPFKYPCCGWRAFSQRDEYPSGPCPLAWPAGDPTHAPGGVDRFGGWRRPPLSDTGWIRRAGHTLSFAVAPVHRHGDGTTPAVCAARCSRQPTFATHGAALPPHT